MKILFASTEMVPYAKTGGLADVVAALPPALTAESLATESLPTERVEVAVILPRWRSVETAGLKKVGRLSIPVSKKRVSAEVLLGRSPSGTTVYFLDAPQYFDRAELYQENGEDYLDNCERFAFFSRAVCEFWEAGIFRADVLHLHDWFTGLVPVYLDAFHRDRPRPATLFTIHNIAYQGVFWHYDMHLLGLPWSYFTFDRLEFFGKINFLKGGIVFADKVSTVSARYAEEIQTPRFGAGLDAVLRHRADDLVGIQNGIDVEAWNPATDLNLAARYDANSIEKKAANKADLQRMASLPEDAEAPLFASIGRLTEQKGIDLILGAVDEILADGGQLVVLGRGDPELERHLKDSVRRRPRQVAVFFDFSEALAHKIEGGADFFLMPSRFEPSGLNQLYSMRYGTVPIVHEVGGLADTVEDDKTGIVFSEPTVAALSDAVRRAKALWGDRGRYRAMQREGMSRDFSWKSSAKRYREVYRAALEGRRT